MQLLCTSDLTASGAVVGISFTAGSSVLDATSLTTGSITAYSISGTFSSLPGGITFQGDITADNLTLNSTLSANNLNVNSIASSVGQVNFTDQVSLTSFFATTAPLAVLSPLRDL